MQFRKLLRTILVWAQVRTSLPVPLRSLCPSSSALPYPLPVDHFLAFLMRISLPGKYYSGVKGKDGPINSGHKAIQTIHYTVSFAIQSIHRYLQIL